MVTKKTLWEKLFPDRVHKHAQKSSKINYANKYIIRIILFFLIENIALIKIREYQFMRNMLRIANAGGGPPTEVVRTLRDTMLTENLAIIIITAAISIGLLYYCDSKMTNGGQ
jgi:hypothetical protein